MHPCTLAFLHGQRCLHDSAVVDMRWAFLRSSTDRQLWSGDACFEIAVALSRDVLSCGGHHHSQQHLPYN